MKILYTIAAIMISAASCTTKTDIEVMSLQNQQIGITSAHNARQLGGYRIADKKIKKDLLLRTAGLFSLSQILKLQLYCIRKRTWKLKM